PVGYGSKNPNYLPLFFMYDFDFIKSIKTKINCSIDNNKISIDKFPFPMNMQFRYFVRYSNQCELIEFANTDSKDLTEVNIDNNSYMDGNIEYIFEESNSLEKIIVHLENENININFIPSLNMNKNITGCFKILPNPKMGHLDGIYNVTKEAEKTIIKLSITDGWRPVPTSFISKLILNKNSIFCKWSKKYEFIAEINTTKKLVKSKWKNNN
ncbi:MAG: hypothetical protein PHI05_03255, partial [Bacilli bacterium]|nr:hypothetical protein [Bacilli bacterium]